MLNGQFIVLHINYLSVYSMSLLCTLVYLGSPSSAARSSNMRLATR